MRTHSGHGIGRTRDGFEHGSLHIQLGTLLLRDHTEALNLSALFIAATAQTGVASRQREKVHVVKAEVLRANVAQCELLAITQ